MDYKKYAIFRDYDDYIIFSNGKIYNSKEDRFLKPHLDNKYYRINLKKNDLFKQFMFHRILGICFLKNPYNFDTIDHIDRNSKNNDLSNLRWSSNRLQTINQNIRKDNKLGIKGVCFSKNNNYYIATWSVNNKQNRKSFSLNKYPNAKELAINYRKEMVDKYYKDII